MYEINTNNNKYYRSEVAFVGTLEFVDNDNVETYYNFSTNYTTVANCINEEVKSNLRPHKDIFKEKFEHDKLFWKVKISCR